MLLFQLKHGSLAREEEEEGEGEEDVVFSVKDV